MDSIGHKGLFMSKSWQISRRTILRGLGATLALPALDIMNSAKAGQTAGRR